MDARELKTVEDAREYFANDKFAKEATGCEIEDARAGYAKCTLVLDERHYNAVGGVMGGAIYTLADYAFAIAAGMTGHMNVSLTGQISFLSATRGKKLIAEAEMIKSGRSTTYYRVTVTDDLDRLIAEVNFNGFVVG
ncbi:MAG: PaaI family thioesterase [Lachnospiraceae bacterium]|nr:PaaI family thioesterase [Lachnospiraceae bacterium]